MGKSLEDWRFNWISGPRVKTI